MIKSFALDLGSTNSCMSIYENGKYEIIPNAEGERTTKSIVAITNKGERLVGTAAERQMIVNAENTVTIVKRLMGQKYNDVKEYIKDLPYKVVAAPNGDCRIVLQGKEYSPEEISSYIIAKMKKDMEAYLGNSVEEICVTVPAYFSNEARESTKVACELAGLKVLRIINEPTAASLAYSDGKSISKKIAVYDLGGSTYDTSILDISDGVVEVLATGGNVSLGGHDVDVAIMNYIMDEFKKTSGIDLRNDKMALQRVKDEAEKAKCALSTAQTYDVSLPFITANENGAQHLNVTITRPKLEELAYDTIQKTVSVCKQCLVDSGVSKVDEVLLVGGMTRMPAVQKLVKEVYGLEPSKGISPDEAVAAGAAVQIGVLTGDKSDLLLLDVTPLTLSICTNGELATPMIERNTTIPTKKTQTFSNATPMQSMATILIGQGERKMFNDNKLLGQFNVEITPCPNVGQSQIEVTYDIDANGILTVSAKDLALNKTANITITNSSGLSKDEIEKAKMEAEKFAEEDKKKVELVNTKNSAEGLCNMIEKTMSEAGDKLTEDDKKPVMESITKTREDVKSDDLEKIKSALEALNKTWEPIVTKLYPQTQNAGQNMSKEDLEKMFKEHPEMFQQATGQQTNANGPVDAEVVG